jgi:hypothetical protein
MLPMAHDDLPPVGLLSNQAGFDELVKWYPVLEYHLLPSFLQTVFRIIQGHVAMCDVINIVLGHDVRYVSRLL